MAQLMRKDQASQVYTPKDHGIHDLKVKVKKTPLQSAAMLYLYMKILFRNKWCKKNIVLVN